MARYWVTSNTADGFNGRRRGYPAKETGNPDQDYPRGFGWYWLKTGQEVEVIEQDEDPKHQPVGDGAVRTIGKRTYAAIKADSHIFVGPLNADGEDGELARARAKIAELEAKLAGKVSGETPDAQAQPTKPAKAAAKQ